MLCLFETLFILMLKFNKVLYKVPDLFMFLAINLLQMVNFTHLHLQIISNSCIFFFIRF